MNWSKGIYRPANGKRTESPILLMHFIPPPKHITHPEDTSPTDAPPDKEKGEKS